MLSKYVWLISVEEISFIRSCDVEEIKATDCIIKVHITSGNIKWRSFALRFCASNHKSAWQPLLPSAKGLSFTLCWVSLPTSFHLRSKHLCQLCIDSYILAYLHSSYYFMLTIIHEICMLKVESNCWNLYLPLCCFNAFTLNYCFMS